MSVGGFIPMVWTAKLLVNLGNLHVYAQCCNRDYEGEIAESGDTVRITSVARPTIAAYTKNSSTLTPETLITAGQSLVVDQCDSFCWEIDDVDKRQVKGNLMPDAIKESAYGFAETVDDYLAALIAAGVDTGNQLTAATVGTGAADEDLYEKIVDLEVKLDENNTPGLGRWCVIPPWCHGLLKKDPRFVSFGTPENRRLLRGEPIGEVSSFTIYKSNNCPVSTATYTLLAGYKGAVTYAEQINKVEAFRPESSFSDAVKGLILFGAKVTRPSNLASIAVTAA